MDSTYDTISCLMKWRYMSISQAVKVLKASCSMIVNLYHRMCVHFLNELAGVTSPCMGLQLTKGLIAKNSP